MTACGGQNRRSASPTSSTRSAGLATQPAAFAYHDGYVMGDDDGDDLGGIHDDRYVRRYGRAANPGEKRAVTTLIEHYYAAAAANDSSRACPLLAKGLRSAGSTLVAAAEREAPAPGAPPLRSRSCGYIASLLFGEHHAQLVTDTAGVKVEIVRVKGNHGVALLAFRTKHERQFPLVREGGAWKAASLLDRELP
jgi:hypothetical protein